MTQVPDSLPLLEVRDLTVEFATRRGTVRAVEQVNLSAMRGEIVGIVGESGSGKSVTSYALMRILDRAGRIAGGSIVFSGMSLETMREAEMRDLRGREISMVFQNPRAALNPIGRQIEDVLLRHGQATRADAREKAIAMLERVRIARPAERYNAYPFELSGGMCQRVVIALALACRPQLLIADEPTTGLDVTTQQAVMELIVELPRERRMAAILITHDLGLAAAYCDTVMVMEKGQVVEAAPARTIFSAPSHPYTQRLLRATPRPGMVLRDLVPEPRPLPVAAAIAPGRLLDVRGLVKTYGAVNAVDGIDLHVDRGESVGLVGESGCGKSTTSMMVMRLLDPTDGSIHFDNQEIGTIPARAFATNPLRKRIQMVFQDPTDSLNPRFTAERAIADPILRMGARLSRSDLRARCEELATQVGLPLHLLDRFPHQLSGGQKARVGIARAIALHPDLVVLDEPTAALDVSVQAVVLNLLQDLKLSLGISYLFVSHDLHVVRLLCDRVIVMRAGKIVEQGTAEQVLEAPTAAYTRELIAAVPQRPH